MSLAAVAGATLIRVLGATWRLDLSGVAADESRPADGGGCILAFWHSRLLPLVYTHRGRGIAVLVSRHRDGEVIARILGHMGCVTARGSSTRGGSEGARKMLSYARDGRTLAITPDGPVGPAERVKAGVVHLASRSGLPVVPLAAAASPAHVFRSWDGFRLPYPFARVVVAYGEPLTVPAQLDADSSERWRQNIEDAIGALTLEVARRVGERS